MVLKEVKPKIFLLWVFLTLLWILSFLDKKFIFLIFFVGLIILFTIILYRDPKRKTKKIDLVLYSPSDGKVVDISEKQNYYIVKIQVSLFNVHVQRSPVDAFVKKILTPDFYNYQYQTEYSYNNSLIELETSDKNKILINYIPSKFFKKIKYFIKEQSFVNQTERIGFLLGSEVYFEFPKDKYALLVIKNQKVYAGITAVAVRKCE